MWIHITKACLRNNFYTQGKHILVVSLLCCVSILSYDMTKLVLFNYSLGLSPLLLHGQLIRIANATLFFTKENSTYLPPQGGEI